MTGSSVARRMAARVTHDPQLSEAATIYTQLDGAFDDRGEWIPGAFTRTLIRCVTLPVTGAERKLMPEGLVDLETRRFLVRERVSAYGNLSEGDVLHHDDRLYRAVVVRDWGGYRDVLAVLPTDAAITIQVGAFSSAFSSAFDVLRTVGA